EASALSHKWNSGLVYEPMPYGSVLVVDDVEANLYVAQELMSFYDLQIETAKSGQAAIDKIKSGKTYSVIFMDYMMPDMDGVEAAGKIRELDYKGYMVAFTANAMIGQAEKFIEQGFDSFLSKPIQSTQLDTILHKFIRAKQSVGS
ncbi:MAG: response regulator, partial [Defluviitaleaceae bacterium]|nr:response regulator [Defluviitaleaceae bacterium]